jgi:uncharacterized coiled-coil DUF342 family protein
MNLKLNDEDIVKRFTDELSDIGKNLHTKIGEIVYKTNDIKEEINAKIDELNKNFNSMSDKLVTLDNKFDEIINLLKK